jgi:uncharacterized protein YceH (UPF0502 family)
VEPLNQHEIRVLGCLVEKQRTVPDSYPLTLNALLSACNQTSNREPVLSMEPFEIEAALAGLRSHGLARVVHSQSNRAEKYRHVVGEALGLEDDAITVLAPLLLRGPQTANELRTRTERYEPGVLDVEDALRVLASRDDPLVVNIGKRSGQREERWMHLLGGPVDPDEFQAPAGSKEVTSPSADRLAALEERVAKLEAQLEELLG